MQDAIKEIRTILAKHNLITGQELADISDQLLPDTACNLAEDCLSSGKPGAQMTRDLRRLISIFNSMDED